MAVGLWRGSPDAALRETSAPPAPRLLIPAWLASRGVGRGAEKPLRRGSSPSSPPVAVAGGGRAWPGDARLVLHSDHISLPSPGTR